MKKKAVEEEEVEEEAVDKAARKAAKRKAKQEADEANADAENRVDSTGAKRQKKEKTADVAEEEMQTVKKTQPAGKEADVEDDDDVASLTKKQKKKARKAQKKVAKTAKHAEKVAELANIHAKNKNLKEKGKQTKKDIYLAKKAAIKAAKGGSKEPPKAATRDEDVAVKAKDLDPLQTDCFLTGLPYAATEQHIIKHFESIGACSAEVLRDQHTGKPRGTAFIIFKTASEAAEACNQLDGSTMQKRWIKVRVCEVRENGKRKKPDLLRGPGEKTEGCVSVVVTGLLLSVVEDDLWTFFKDCNPSTICMMTNKETGAFRGMAFVDFEDSGAVDVAVKLSGQSIKGKPCFIRYKVEKKDEAAVPHVAEAEVGGPKKHFGNQIAPHNRAPPVPKFAGKATKLADDSDSD